MPPFEQAIQRVVRLALLALAFAAPLRAQDSTKADWEWFALPALNFNSDEGFGYGALLELYNYRGGVKPYRLMIRPLLAFSTKGKRDFTVAIDAPGLLPPGWRLDAYLGREQQLATPWYGVGNNTVKDEALSDPPDAYYYRYGKTQYRIMSNLQRKIGASARWLVGAGYADVTTDATPFDSGTTLLRQQLGVAAADPEGTIAFVRGGVVIDTRDREIGPTRGAFTDVLIQRVDEGLGASSSYTRVTGTWRKYTSLTPKVVFASRVIAQHTDGSVPFFDLSTIQTSTPAQQAEGLGGSSSMRGIEKNRFTGRTIAVANIELRYRFKEMRLIGKPAYLVATGFGDAGRVWDDFPEANNGGLHFSGGGGLRIGLGPSFLVAFDVGRSSESTQIYIGLGYPF